MRTGTVIWSDHHCQDPPDVIDTATARSEVDGETKLHDRFGKLPRDCCSPRFDLAENWIRFS
jgi:hypothetical protein